MRLGKHGDFPELWAAQRAGTAGKQRRPFFRDEMQTLQQIELAAATLHGAWEGRRLLSIDDLSDTGLERHLANMRAADLRPHLAGRRIHSVRRHGRHLLVTFRTGLNPYRWTALQWTVSVSGKLALGPAAGAFCLRFEDGQEWVYADACGWGRIWVWTHAEVVQQRAGALAHLGPDWLRAPRAAREALRCFNSGSVRTAKAVVLDQTVAAGVDNVIACEAFYAACIHPLERWYWLTPGQRLAIADAVAGEVERPRAGAATLAVYGRRDDWCLRENCESCILSVPDPPPLTTRSYFCPACQRSSENP